MEIGDRLLRLAGSGEEGALIALQHAQPGLNVSGMIAARFGFQLQIRAQERRSQFGDQFFHGIPGVAEASREVAMEVTGRTRKVDVFVT